MSRFLSRLKSLTPSLWQIRRVPRPIRALGALLLVAAIAAIAWLLVQVWPEGRDETWDRIVSTGVLRVCTDPSWPPFETVDERTGAFRGLDIELAEQIAARLAPGATPQRFGGSVRAEIVPVGFDSLYDALLAGRCDAVLSALPYEPERTEDVAYTVSYFNAGLVIVVRDGTGGIETLADLPGKSIGVEWGFVPEGDSRQRLLLQSLPLHRYDTALDVLGALQSGEIDVALVDQISALSYAGECGHIHLVGPPFTEVSYVIPVRQDSFRLLSELNRVLGEMRGDRTLDGLLAKWF